MNTSGLRTQAKAKATSRKERKVELPMDSTGKRLNVSHYFGMNVFNVLEAEEIPEKIKEEIREVVTNKAKNLSEESAKVVAKTVMDWALSRGVTHFCHWFQPLTGATAEKHDAFLDIDFGTGKPIEKFSSSMLLQGEPDASSFPHGGSRSTFEARGYTSWDFTSPLFIIESANSSTLCIPTAFVSYNGDALDVKAPLLRSISALNREATKFLNTIGEKDVTEVTATCGCEQEYFLIDKALFNARPDLVMTGRTLLGSLSAKNQQLSDHYFGTINDRVVAFMGELDHELYKLGIPAKTRHNEVAPGQFEIAPVFSESNVAADQNQILMATITRVAEKHNFKAALHEKPFAEINGSGKHLNWSMATNTGINLLEPGNEPESNVRFLTVVSTIVAAVHRHAEMLRMAIASASNDHRLGANEAPPSIISVFLGDTLGRIFEAIHKDETFTPTREHLLEMGTEQLAHLQKDNTDRNRTSPFAFTGNKFEFRAVGSSRAVGYPLTFLNTAVAATFAEATSFIESEVAAGKSIEGAQTTLTKKWMTEAYQVIFNGDGYSDEWVKEAESRGLSNLRTTADALPVLRDEEKIKFLIDMDVLKRPELETRHNVLTEQYNLLREIEFRTQIQLVNQHVIPSVIGYKRELAKLIDEQEDIKIPCSVERELLKRINFALESLYSSTEQLKEGLNSLGSNDTADAKTIAGTLFPLSEKVAESASALEDIVPDSSWTLPTYFDMLFLR
ncbi:MAG: glutamine synthetase III [Bacteriovoracaceae bacterium]